ncbi:hypothetical protein E4P42_11190 [Mycobacterium sp. PS03-16]|uniref:hypothetical protein n=1 Tax=Mycobacterium sp. PS03-16 TaxID=2559611 RepID=UPI0010748093|nr:hypothetical protein [Mycobacterium sp. PS03-16]TFV58652.1 hypothetical protein E4P42_11190 [Mycobacterium sp. PS03-16]
MSAPIALLLTACALITIFVAATRVAGIARVFLIAQVAYWSLSYVAQPLVLLWLQPAPRYGDSIADPRLADAGYDRAIGAVMEPVVVGLWVYAALAVGYAVWSRHRPPRTAAILGDPVFLPTMWTIYVLGTLGRLQAVATGTAGEAGEIRSADAILLFVTGLAMIGALGIIVFFRSESAVTSALVISGIAAAEFLWTVASESKTPVMGAALGLAVRFAISGWTRRRATLVIALAVAGVGAFGFLQSFKTSGPEEALADAVNANYPAAVQPFLPVLRRFDLLGAATDVYYLDGRPWLSAGEVVEKSVEALIPAQLLGHEKDIAGVMWANEVRGASVDMTDISVSLAEGNISESFALGGYPGVTLGAAFLLGLVVAWSRALYTRSVVLLTLGLAIVEIPILFERGLLGSVETIGKYVQVAIAVWLVYLCVDAAMAVSRRRIEVIRSSPDYSMGAR